MTFKHRIVNSKILVEYPHGAGGAFLSRVLACCTTNLPWKPGPINFHNLTYKVNNAHWYDDRANNIISINDSRAKYNFWIYYFRKRVVHELIHYRYQQQRWIKCPYADVTAREDGLWLLNQCRFIMQYQTNQPWKISWIEMLENPANSWKTIQNFLESNNQPNHWNIDQWNSAVDDYRKTLSKVVINQHHARWQIWAAAVLQEQGMIPDFDLVDNFRKVEFVNWIDGHSNKLVEYTKQSLWTPG